MFTQEQLDKIIAISTPQIASYLLTYNKEIEYKQVENKGLLKLPAIEGLIIEMKVVNELTEIIKNALNLELLSVCLKPFQGNYTPINKYQTFTKTTAIYPKHQAMNYLGLGLTSEAGEVAGVLKKWVRGDYSTEEMRERLKGELGDVLWYLARIADEQGMQLQEIININMKKLQNRKNSGVIKGDGDFR